MAARGARAAGRQAAHHRVLGLGIGAAGQGRWVAVFLQRLRELGWIEGRNLQIDARWGAGDAADTRRAATELAALALDVIVASGSAGAAAVLEATRTVPIVFVIVPDPVGAGFVESLAQPGGNATGFMMFEYGLSAKWLELLKEIAPGVDGSIAC